MYVFDVLCGTFSLVTLLLYAYDRWILSLLAFWLAYKSKELAVMLPAVLVFYELWLGKKRWVRLLPFLAISLSWGLQGLIRNPGRGTPYELEFGLAAQVTTLSFYGSRLFFLPYAGAVLLLLAVLVRDRRLWFGLAVTCLMMVPLLILPGRLFAVYWYVPLAGVAIMLAAIADGRYRLAVVLFLLLWTPWDFVNFRQQRRDNLRLEARNRAYVTELARFAKLHPGQRLFVYDGTPDNFHSWGITGAVACINKVPGIRAQSIDDPGARDDIESGEAAWLHWSPTLARLEIVQYPKVRRPLPYVPMNIQTPPWQLLFGWYSLDADFRWTHPDATAQLLRPENAKGFEIAACVVPEQLRNHATVDLGVVLDGRPLGDHKFTTPGCEKLRWPVPRKSSAMAMVELHIAPPFHPINGDTRVLGITVSGLGFVSE
ncbi:MAG: hypothetical protein JWO48_3865 [Bryobacterales bacterium]|nr:hypothetical protein [Bryobacterales bacterium]